MSENLVYCVRGCVRARAHLSDCTEESCGGCEPRRANHGLLCWPCHRRFELMLRQVEITDRWLTGNLPAGNQAARAKEDYETRGGTKEPPAPLTVAILDCRDLLRDRLASWADDLTESRSLKGPPRHTVEADSKFLMTWLTTSEHLDWVGDWFEELAETMSEAHCLAPWRPAMNRLPKVPCPECHKPALAIFGGEEDATCLECKHIVTPARYGVWSRAFESGEDLGDVG